jgi:hypothetical protein
MSTVGSVGYALARALAPAPEAERVVVYIGAPDLDPPVRESKPMPRAEAEAFAAELRAHGTFLGSPISGVHVGEKSAPVSAETAQARERRDNAPHFLPNRQRKVRASAGRWRGETNGSHWERTSTENRTQFIETGLRKGWAL